jgi:4'-phosphopantetheinyl transferase
VNQGSETIAALLRTSDWPGLTDLAAQLLSPAELARAGATLDGADQLDYRAAHVLVRLLAARFAGVPPAAIRLTQSCERCGGPHGRPVVESHPGVQVSLSHTRGTVLAAAGPGPLGVDVEDLRRPPVDPGLARSVLSQPALAALASAPDQHTAFLQQWVRQEALFKAGVREPGGLHLLEQLDQQERLVYAVVSGVPVTLVPVTLVTSGDVLTSFGS